MFPLKALCGPCSRIAAADGLILWARTPAPLANRIGAVATCKACRPGPEAGSTWLATVSLMDADGPASRMPGGGSGGRGDIQDFCGGRGEIQAAPCGGPIPASDAPGFSWTVGKPVRGFWEVVASVSPPMVMSVPGGSSSQPARAAFASGKLGRKAGGFLAAGGFGIPSRPRRRRISFCTSGDFALNLGLASSSSRVGMLFVRILFLQEFHDLVAHTSHFRLVCLLVVVWFVHRRGLGLDPNGGQVCAEGSVFAPLHHGEDGADDLPLLGGRLFTFVLSRHQTFETIGIHFRQNTIVACDTLEPGDETLFGVGECPGAGGARTASRSPSHTACDSGAERISEEPRVYRFGVLREEDVEEFLAFLDHGDGFDGFLLLFGGFLSLNLVETLVGAALHTLFLILLERPPHQPNRHPVWEGGGLLLRRTFKSDPLLLGRVAGGGTGV